MRLFGLTNVTMNHVPCSSPRKRSRSRLKHDIRAAASCPVLPATSLCRSSELRIVVLTLDFKEYQSWAEWVWRLRWELASYKARCQLDLIASAIFKWHLDGLFHQGRYLTVLSDGPRSYGFTISEASSLNWFVYGITSSRHVTCSSFTIRLIIQ